MAWTFFKETHQTLGNTFIRCAWLALTHSDFAPLVGLCDPNTTPAQVSVHHWQMRFSFTHFSIAHVKSDNITAVPRHKSAHTRGSVHHAAALPLTDVDLKRPESAFIQNERSYLVVLIAPVNKQRKTFVDFFAWWFMLIKSIFFLFC